MVINRLLPLFLAATLTSAAMGQSILIGLSHRQQFTLAAVPIQEASWGKWSLSLDTLAGVNLTGVKAVGFGLLGSRSIYGPINGIVGFGGMSFTGQRVAGSLFLGVGVRF